ncbi:hypothetical protein TSAR_009399, partial [Trichomalopsis sarcophagae]
DQYLNTESDVEIEQVQRLFEDPIIINAVEERFYRNKVNENALEDIFDGKIYKNYSKNPNLLGNPYNFSYTFSMDGCKSSDSSKVTIWPIYMMIHEFPYFLRRQCMYFSNHDLSTRGFKWKYNSEDVVSCLFPLGCCVESPCRASMLNMKRFNGFYGCTYYEHPTESVDGVRKYPMLNDPPDQHLNTESDVENEVEEAHLIDDIVTESCVKTDKVYISSFFIEIDPVQQLQIVVEDPIVINALEDIFDGKIYKEYSKNPNLLGNPYNF